MARTHSKVGTPDSIFRQACTNGDLTTVKGLHASGYDLDDNNGIGLYVASLNGKCDVVEYLLDHGQHVGISRALAVATEPAAVKILAVCPYLTDQYPVTYQPTPTTWVLPEWIQVELERWLLWGLCC